MCVCVRRSSEKCFEPLVQRHEIGSLLCADKVTICARVCVCFRVPEREEEEGRSGGWTPQECFFDNKFPQRSTLLF